VIALAVGAAVLAGWLWWVPHPHDRAVRLTISGALPLKQQVLTRLRNRTRRDDAAALDALAALAAELRAGQPPILALRRTGTQVWPRAAAAARLGGDLTQALRADARDEPALRGLAACWEITARTGSGMAITVQRLADSVRSTQETRVHLRAQLAAPRATARMLAALPLIGILLGHVLGADPITWLLGSAFGLVVVILAAVCTGVGWWWISRIARQVERLL
jgi:tight adherence protein B